MAQTGDVVVRAFSSGEFAPELAGRGDLARYQSAVARCENFIPTVTGSIEKRPGFILIDNTDEILSANPLDYDTNIKEGSRLIPFQFNVRESYTLIFSPYGSISGPVGMFVIKDGRYITSGGSLYSMDHTYTAEQLSEIGYAQSGDLIYLTQKDHPPRKLTRIADDNWTLTDVTFASAIPAPVISSTSSTTNRWRVTAVSALGEESLASASSKRAPGETLKWNQVDGAVTYNVYLKQSADDTNPSSYGWYAEIGSPESLTDPVAYQIPSTLVEADSSKTPQFSNRHPFEVSTGVYSYPAYCAFFQQRMVYGRSDSFPQTVWGSRVGSYDNFNISYPLLENDAFEWAVAATAINEITAIVPMQDLLIFTAGSEWKMSGSDGGSLTAKSVSAVRQSQWGSSNVTPLVVGSSVLFVERDRRTVRDFEFSFEVDSYTGGNLSLFASHLFDGYTITRWAYQRRPYFCVWAVRNDGILLCFTYDKDQQVWGWSQHTTLGFVSDVIVILRDSMDDQLYILVARRALEYNGLGAVRSLILSGVTAPSPYGDPPLRYNEMYATYGEPTGLILMAENLTTTAEELLGSFILVDETTTVGITISGPVWFNFFVRDIAGSASQKLVHPKLYKRSSLGVETLVCDLDTITYVSAGKGYESYSTSGTAIDTLMETGDLLVAHVYGSSPDEVFVNVTVYSHDASDAIPGVTRFEFQALSDDEYSGYVVEYQGPRKVNSAVESQMLDSSSTGSTIAELNTKVHQGKTITVLADGNVIPNVVVGLDELSGEGTLTAGTEEEQYVIDNASVLTIGLPYTAILESLSIEPSNQQSIAKRFKTINSMHVRLIRSGPMWYGPVEGGRIYEAKMRTNENYGEPTELYTGYKDLDVTAGAIKEARYQIQGREPLPLNIVGIDLTLSVAGS